METKEASAIFVSAFVLGAIGAFKVAKRKQFKLRKENNILQMKVDTLVGFVTEIAEYGDPVEAVTKFKTSYDFINLIDGI